jgi:hypothetical protein
LQQIKSVGINKVRQTLTSFSKAQEWKQMLTSIPLEDEVAEGYWRRLIRLGRYSSQEVAKRALKQHVAELEGGRPELPIVYLLAQLSGLSSEDFCRQHTMLPFVRAVTNTQSGLVHGDICAITLSRRMGMALPGAGAYACRRCVERDLDKSRYAHFRRTHQLPMIIRCEEDDEPLVWSSSADAFKNSPSEILRSPDPLPYDLDSSICEHPIVNRYITIVKMWLQSSKTIPLYLLHSVLLDRAKSHGLRICDKGSRKLLSDFAVEKCPPNWLEAFLPGLSKKKRGVFHTTIDSVIRNGTVAFRTRFYALALALLFDSAEEALDSTIRPVLSGVGAREKSAKIRTEHEKQRGFIKQYIATRGNTALIAEAAGIGVRTQRAWIVDLHAKLTHQS